MNKQKIKKKKNRLRKLIKFQNKIIISLVFILWIWVWIAFANTFPKIQIAAQEASNNSHDDYKISIKTSSWAYYVNNGNNSAIIWNYFEWYYYDSLYWVFKFDWSSDKTKNVRVIDSTNKCSSSYWYNLWWKAKSDNWWFIDFSWVYYCLADGKLHWKWNNSLIWEQDFEWIAFEIITKGDTTTQKDSKDDVFVNDDTKVDNKEKLKWEESETSNAWDFKIWWNEFHVDDTSESIFYIIK